MVAVSVPSVYQKEGFQKDWKIWEGIEVESRLVGILTLFFSSNCKVADIPQDLDLDKYPQLYFNPGFVTEEGLDFIQGLQYKGIITICVTEKELKVLTLYKNLCDTCHIMLSVSIPEFGLLKGSDTLRIDVDNFYNFHCQKISFGISTLSDYMGDKKIV